MKRPMRRFAPRSNIVLKHRLEPCCTAHRSNRIGRYCRHLPRPAACAVALPVISAGLAPALALDPTGDWRVADGVANIRVAECNGSMWGAVAWEKTPGGRDTHNPDVSKQNRPTLGMPILIDMKKKSRRRSMGRSSLQRQGRAILQLDDQAGRSRPAGDSGLRAGLPLRRRNLDPRCRADSVEAPPTAWPKAAKAGGGQSRAALPGRPRAPKTARRPRRRPTAVRKRRTDRQQERRPPAGRSRRRYLPTPRHRAVCPLAPAGTAAPRQAS